MRTFIRNIKYLDKTFLFVIFLFLLFSSLNIISSSTEDVIRFSYGTFYFFKSNIINILIGFIAFIITINIPLKWYKNNYLLFIPILILLYMLFYIRINNISFRGSMNWFPITATKRIQPSELLKPFIIIYFAASIDKLFSKKKPSLEKLLPSLAVIIGMIILVLSTKDLGTSLVIIGIFGAMFFALPFTLKELI